MAFAPEIFMKASMKVLWYIDDCKIPEEIGPYSTVINIKSALNKMGYHGRLAITAYGDFSSQRNTRKVLRYAGVDVVNRPAEKQSVRVAEIIGDVFSWAMTKKLLPSNLLIISEDVSGDSAFVRAIQKLHYSRRCNVILAQPQCASGPILNVLGYQWLWKSLAAGGEPDTQSQGAESSNTKKDEAKTSVWWDIDRCPVPEGCDARQIAPSIKRALRSLGYDCPLTITAIGELKDVPVSDLQALYSTGVALKIIPSRALSILGDMSDWMETNPPPANIMFISDNEVLFPSLGGIWLNKGYNILYAHIPGCMQDFKFPFPAECLWQNILKDAMDTRRNELQEQCIETGEPVLFCKACKTGVQNFENYSTHLYSKEHSQTMLDYYRNSNSYKE